MQTLDAGPDLAPGSPIPMIPDDGRAGRRGEGFEPEDPADLMLTCANCGARMDERTCKLICRCGYFLSCSDYY